MRDATTGEARGVSLDLARELVRAPTSPMVVDMMVAQGLDVAAGVKQQLEADGKRVPGVRLLAGRFMVINQAMATPKGRTAGARYLAEFVEEMKASGFVENALAATRHRRRNHRAGRAMSCCVGIPLPQEHSTRRSFHP